MKTKLYNIHQHGSYRLKYNLILTINQELSMSNSTVKSFILNYTKNFFDERKCTMLDLSFKGNHIRIVFEAHPNINLSQLVNAFKSASSRKVKGFIKEQNKCLLGQSFWEKSYLICTDTSDVEELINQYIENRNEKQEKQDMIRKKDIYNGKDYKKLHKNYIGKRNWILSENIKINIDCEKSDLNNNVLVIGGAGTGKGYRVILPNLLEANSNYVVLDVNGDLYGKTSDFFKSKGYSTKVLDLSNQQNKINATDKVSYTPFAYLKHSSEVYWVVDALMNATNKTVEHDLMRMNEKIFLVSCIRYLLIEKQFGSYVTFNLIYELLNNFELDLYNQFEKVCNVLDKDKSDILTASNFKRMQLMNENVIMSVIKGIKQRLEAFHDIKGYDSFNGCTCDLNSFTKSKQILYIELSMFDSSFNFLIPILYQQLVRLINESENFQSEYHTRFIFDEFVNVYGMDEVVRCMKKQDAKRNSYMFVTQNLIQLKQSMPNEWDDLLCECDSMLFMGSHNIETVKYISNRLEEKMNEQDVMYLKNDQCIAFILGSKPIIDQKYDIKKHQNYKEIREDVQKK